MFRTIVHGAVELSERCIATTESLFVRAINTHSIYSTKSVPLELAYDHYAPGNKSAVVSSPIIVSHGLFANRKIWEPISKTIAEKVNRDVYAIDLRNHGDSPFSEEFFLPDITVDVEKFITELPNAPTLVGHSLGALCSMLISITKPQLIRDLVLIDSSPVSFPEGMELHVIYFTKKMREVLPKIPRDLNLNDAKNFVDAFFQSSVPVPFVRKLLLSSLSKTDDGFKWKVNLDPTEKIFGNPKIFDLFPFKGMYNGDVTLIYAEHSPYVKLTEETGMKKIFPKLKLHRVADCTHWIYEDKPDELIDILVTLLR